MRFIAPSPVPGLPPVEKPSRMDFAMSAMPAPLSDRADAAKVAVLQRLCDQLAAASVLHQVAADLHRDQRCPACILFVEPLSRRERGDGAARLRDLTRFGDCEALHVTSSA